MVKTSDDIYRILWIFIPSGWKIFIGEVQHKQVLR